MPKRWFVVLVLLNTVLLFGTTNLPFQFSAESWIFEGDLLDIRYELAIGSPKHVSELTVLPVFTMRMLEYGFDPALSAVATPTLHAPVLQPGDATAIPTRALHKKAFVVSVELIPLAVILLDSNGFRILQVGSSEEKGAPVAFDLFFDRLLQVAFDFQENRDFPVDNPHSPTPMDLMVLNFFLQSLR